MSTSRAKPIKVRRKSLKRISLTGSMRQKKRERSEIRKKTCMSTVTTPLDQGCTPSDVASPSSLEEEDSKVDACLSPVLEECAKNKTSPSPSTNKEVLGDTVPPPTSSDVHDIYNPAIIFPCSNKPHETREKTIAEESKQWESFFDPQHTFGSFHSTLAKQPNQHFYRGKWPLDQEDLMGIIPKSTKRHSRLIDSEQPSDLITTTTTFVFPTVPSPTLPRTNHLQIHTTAYENEEYEGNNTSIEILPCPSLSSFTKLKKVENEEVWKKRLELLSAIQKDIFDEKWNGTGRAPFKESTTARLQRQIKTKAERIKKETLVDSSTDDDDDDDEKQQQQQQQQQQEPEEKPKEHVEATLAPSLNSLNDSWENISFNPPPQMTMHKKGDLENQQVVEVKRKNRPSFLLFAYGFLFPPLWVVGAFYRPGSSIQRTTASKRIDMKWSKYSRNAFFIFLSIVVVIVVLILALKPEAVGFRNSNNQDYQNEEKVIFDDSKLIQV